MDRTICRSLLLELFRQLRSFQCVAVFQLSFSKASILILFLFLPYRTFYKFRAFSSVQRLFRTTQSFLFPDFEATKPGKDRSGICNKWDLDKKYMVLIELQKEKTNIKSSLCTQMIPFYLTNLIYVSCQASSFLFFASS